MEPADDSRDLELGAGVLAGDMRSLSRAITLVENDTACGARIHQQVVPHAGSGLVLGFTGPPGVGKSTLVDAYVSFLRESGTTVAVVAVDPSSHVSGGALLGDRIRMLDHVGDKGVFIRSIASRGHLGGLAANVHRIIDLIDAAGWNVIILETVGTGQSEIEIADIADVNIVVSAPGLGDEIQAMKAGILESADVLVVNKCDLPSADLTVKHLSSMLRLRAPDAPPVPVVKTIASTRTGLSDLHASIQTVSVRAKSASTSKEAPSRRVRLWLAHEAAKLAREEIVASGSPVIEELCSRILSGTLSLREAAAQALQAALRKE